MLMEDAKGMLQKPLDFGDGGALCALPHSHAVCGGSLQPLVRFLQTQSVVLLMPLLSFTTLLFHVTLCWLLVYKSGAGFRGAGIASSMSNWLSVLLLALYMKFLPTCTKTWMPFSREAFNDLPAFCKIAIPSTVMICLDLWSDTDWSWSIW